MWPSPAAAGLAPPWHKTFPKDLYGKWWWRLWRMITSRPVGGWSLYEVRIKWLVNKCQEDDFSRWYFLDDLRIKIMVLMIYIIYIYSKCSHNESLNMTTTSTCSSSYDHYIAIIFFHINIITMLYYDAVVCPSPITRRAKSTPGGLARRALLGRSWARGGLNSQRALWSFWALIDTLLRNLFQ
jgi:hypothetical protein